MYWRTRKRNLHVKAQIGIQFMIAVSMAFLILLVLVSNIAYRYKTINDQELRVHVKDLAIKVREELSIASSVDQDYSRSFEIPSKIILRDYNITHSGNFLTVSSGEEEHTVIVPQFSGNFEPGSNNITKDEGGICVNC